MCACVGCGGESSPQTQGQPAAITSSNSIKEVPRDSQAPAPTATQEEQPAADTSGNTLEEAPRDSQAPTTSQEDPPATGTRLPDAGDRTQVIDKLIAAGLCENPYDESPGPPEAYYGAAPAVGLRSCTVYRGTDAGSIRAFQWSSREDYETYLATVALELGIDLPVDDPFTILVGDTISIQVNELHSEDGMTPFEQSLLDDIRSALGG